MPGIWIKIFKVKILLLLVIGLAVFWEKPWVSPLKVFVVYLHEISHALAAVLTRGRVNLIAFQMDESGITQTDGGNFIITALAGYFGSLILGSAMLHGGVSGRWNTFHSLFVGLLLIIFTVFIPEKIPLHVFITGVSWGILFVVTALVWNKLNRALLFFMGGITSLYSLYDLSDFFRGNIARTDAGIIARQYFPESQMELPFAYLVGLIISTLSIWVFIRVLRNALHTAPVEDLNLMDEPQGDETTAE